LWILQGNSTIDNQTDLISRILESDQIDYEQIILLRNVKVHSLVYSSELTLYFNACLKCCQSSVPIIRIYAYSLLRSAPGVVDIRHSFQIFKEALKIWDQGQVSFEFNASFHLLLVRFSEHRPSFVDQK
jgi:DNA polymerase III psi subunit